MEIDSRSYRREKAVHSVLASGLWTILAMALSLWSFVEWGSPATIRRLFIIAVINSSRAVVRRSDVVVLVRKCLHHATWAGNVLARKGKTPW